MAQGYHICICWTEDTEPQGGAGTCLRTQNGLIVWLRRKSESVQLVTSQLTVHSTNL